MEAYKLREKLTPIAAAIAAGAAALTLVGCGESVFAQGGPAKVEAHKYDDPDNYLILVGKVLVPEHDDAHWYLDLIQCDRAGDPSANQAGCVHGEIEVTEQTYNEYPDGSTIVLKPETSG